MKELKNELIKGPLKRSRLTLWLFSQVWSTRYSRASLCQIHWDFPMYNGQVDTKNALLRKQLMYFNVFILAGTFVLAEAAIVRCSPKVVLKVIHKFFKYRKSWFRSVDRTIPIIWSTFSCSNKLFPLCWTYPR